MSVLSLICSLGVAIGALQTPGPLATPERPALTQLPAAPANELDAAEARYRAAIALNPQIAAYRFSLAKVLERKGRTSEALVAYAEAVRLDPTSARNRGGLGELLLNLGDTPRAALQLRAAARLDPSNAAYRLLLAQALISQESWADAARVLREAQKLSPADARVRTLLTQAERRTSVITTGYHDFSDFENETAPVLGIRVAELLFGGLLVLAGVVLLAPIFGTLFLLLIQAPLAWARSGRRPAQV